MSLIAIVVVGAVLGIVWRLVRLAVRVVLLLAVIALIATTVRTWPATATRRRARPIARGNQPCGYSPPP